VFALGRQSPTRGLFTNDVGEGMEGEAVFAQTIRYFALAGRIRAREPDDELPWTSVYGDG
jgi:hypothetical protein